ncbi:uncharacterized protein LOC131681583 [Topomyia yanbarensis]|uniref:uncharacterized protein LOC131681583 n=1 Tax=Topomyia yanbarensis TaxID=2498891 RepID=UPI00273BEF8F|nr:uncharacterized protein LOC131681583 [Topomyia yanbarensis]
MSKSLVKKALALAEEELQASIRKKEADKDNSDLTPHHKSGRQIGKARSKIAKEMKKRCGNLTVIEARKQLQNRKDNTDDNIRKLLLMSSTDIGREVSSKLVKRAQTGRYVVKADEVLERQDPTESVFSEEDFSKFEEELERLG